MAVSQQQCVLRHCCVYAAASERRPVARLDAVVLLSAQDALPCTQQQQQQHWPDRQACEHCTNGALSGDSAHATCSVFPSVCAVSSPSRSSQSLDQTGGPQPPPGMFYGKSQLVARSVCNVAAADADDNVTSAEYRSGIYLPRNQRVGPPSAGTDPVRDIRL